jgi:hypothetical protein
LIDTLSFQKYLTGTDAAGGLEQPDDRLAGEGFAGTGFANDSKNFSRQDIKGYIVHRHQDTATGLKFNSEMFNS